MSIREASPPGQYSTPPASGDRRASVGVPRERHNRRGFVIEYLSSRQLRVLGTLLVGTLSCLASAALAQSPSVEGTYRPVSRTLRDGTVIKPPEVMGLMTYTKGYRNFNILSKDAGGQFTSRSIVATYTLTPTEYVETTLFHIFVRGQEIHREVSSPPQRSLVTLTPGRVEFRLEQRVSIFEGNRFTATSPASTDLWEKVD